MEFSNTTIRDGILQNCEDLCGLGYTGITGNTDLLYKFTGYANQAMDKIAMAILTVDKNWRWDDTASYGDFPVATNDLIDGQRDYVLPKATNSSDISTLWKVYKVRIKDTNGVWYDLIPLASDEDENNSNSTGRPTHYRLLGNSIRLSDTPDTGRVTFTAGIQVWFQRAFVKFLYTDTTKQPAIMSGFHYLLQLDMSASYLLPKDTKLAGSFIGLFTAGIEGLKKAYALRNDDPNITKRLNAKIESTR